VRGICKNTAVQLLTLATEIFPYLKFLRLPKTSTFSEFKAKYLPKRKAEVRFFFSFFSVFLVFAFLSF
jgi:hypothetical protein